MKIVPIRVCAVVVLFILFAGCTYTPPTKDRQIGPLTQIGYCPYGEPMRFSDEDGGLTPPKELKCRCHGAWYFVMTCGSDGKRAIDYRMCVQTERLLDEENQEHVYIPGFVKVHFNPSVSFTEASQKISQLGGTLFRNSVHDCNWENNGENVNPLDKTYHLVEVQVTSGEEDAFIEKVRLGQLGQATAVRIELR